MTQKISQLQVLTEAIREKPIEDCQTLSRRQLIDKLNFLNFQDRDVLINFRHCHYPHSISINAFPDAVFAETLHLRWDPSQDMPKKLTNYRFDHMLLNDGLKLLMVEGEVRSMDLEALELALPIQCREIRARCHRRHPCKGITARFFQNSAQFEGVLADFSPDFLRVQLEAKAPQRFFWIDPDSPGYLILSSGKETLYSGECFLARQGCGEESRDFVFRLAHLYTRRFQTKEFRSSRQSLIPAPEMIFHHPLTGKKVSLGIETLSGSGFAIQEEKREAVLFPGLMLPSVSISFAGTLVIHCQAQVVNRSLVNDQEPAIIRHGVALLDIDIADHVKLEALLQQAGDRHSHCFTPVDMDALWSFFFETGFIYPQKYATLRHKKEVLKKTYEKLYTEHPDIARHFIHQKNGKILGHMSMLRFYENSWLIHHHAATKKETNRAGITVLNQIGSFINDSLNLFSIHMKYVMCYYRPENRFPERIFGGVARHLADGEKCSLDPFAYLHCHREREPENRANPEWELVPCEERDIVHLDCFYGNESGGLMLRAMDLQTESAFVNSIEKEFHKCGFHKERYLLALKKDGVLLAVLLLNLSELGLNMSDLTHCLHLFVPSKESLDKKTLFDAVQEVMVRYDQNELPIMIFPRSYADSAGIGYEKTYNLWIMNLRHVDEYFRYLKRLFRGFQS
ncbi:MAG: pilus assembly protein PilZ [Desulfuromonadaceae bacterium]|nr:pilus assembly protein PilZ [Desulfuromonadaceae bacterium]